MQYLELESKKQAVKDFSRKLFKDRLKSIFPLAAIQPIIKGDSDADILKKAEHLTNEKLVEMSTLSADRYFDGYALYKAAVNDQRETVRKVTAANPARIAMVTATLKLFINWFNKNYGDQFEKNNSAWNSRQLEYQFGCSLPGQNGTNTVLTAGEYQSGNLDWYAFDVNKKAAVDGLTGEATPLEMSNIKSSLLTIIPTPATFAGAPNSRWWAFENGSVDLGNLSTETTGLAKMIFTEYSLLFNNDWFILPYPVPVGSLCEIQGIVVKDVFGEQSFIGSSIQGNTDDWSAWGMYSLSTSHSDGARNLLADTRLFIPPATVKTIESEPVEEVHFVRDETTNNVWAIEARLPDGLGSSMDGYNMARSFTEILQQFEEPSTTGTEATDLYKYALANTIPENWIPFMPVHVPNNNRSIQLQRASMPRLFKNAYSHIRPRTDLLRQNISSDDQQLRPYYINEEEITRAGIHLQSTFQRTRWYNGAVVSWYGYRKKTGKGEALPVCNTILLNR